MPHISYSELKDWVTCAFYHKLTRVDKLKGFKGNEFTAFGSAIHAVCEKKLLKEEINDERFFVRSFNDCIDNLGDDVPVDSGLVDQMVGQGKALLPEIEEAVADYFGEYNVEAVELPLYEPIDGQDDYKFKGFIDAIVSTPDGKVHIFDWKTCSWGWDSKKKSDKYITYQLTLYKKFWCQKYGVDPKEVVYIVSQTGYFQLLEDAEFQDVNLVGDMATKLNGEIGSVFGSKVLVCDEFATAAVSKFHAIAVYPRNYVMPRLRGVTLESDYEVANQRRVLVASQRIGFDDLIAGATSKWAYKYKAS